MGAIYKRVVLKISGELIHKDSANTAISHELLEMLCKQIIAIHSLGIELSIVIGGGNIFRGHAYNDRSSRFFRTDADKMGMLATAINALALRSTLESCGTDTIIQSSIALEGVANRFSVYDTDRALKSGKIAIFCCGTGNPFFSTDSAAALRACELHADVLLKASMVDGAYDSNPHKNPNAKKFDKISYGRVLEKHLSVMDLTAFILCMENNIPIRIFSGKKDGEMYKAVQDVSVGTFIGNVENEYGNR